MPTMTKTRKSSTTTGKLTAGNFFEIVGTKVGLKRKVVRDTVFAVVDTVVTELRKNEEVKIPHLGKIVIKNYPAKKIPAGNYMNPFKRDAEGKPTMEYREARVRAARKKLKFFFASQIKNEITPKIKK